MNRLAAGYSALAVVVCLGLTGPGETQEIKPVHALGNNPFSGTHQEACQLHTDSHDQFTMQECMGAIVLSDDATVCKPSAVLQDSTVWWMLFTINDVHHINLVRISFGAKAPVDDDMRMVNDCTGVPGGKSLVKPHACGNYAVRYVPPEPKAATVRSSAEKPVTKKALPQQAPVPTRSTTVGSSGNVQIFNFGGVHSLCLPRSK